MPDTVFITRAGDTTTVTTPLAVQIPVHVVNSVRLLWRSDSLRSPVSVVRVADRLVVATANRLYLRNVDEDPESPPGDSLDPLGGFARIRALGQSGDSVLVYDEDLRILSYYTAEGVALGWVEIEPDSAFDYVHHHSQAVRSAAGGILMAMRPGQIAPQVPIPAAIVWRATEGPGTEVLEQHTDFVIRRADGRTFGGDPLGSRARLAVGPGGRWAFGDGLEYCVSVSRMGDPGVIRACREWKRQPVTEALRSTDFEEVRQRTGISDSRADSWRAVFDLHEYPDVFPSYDRVQFAENGDLWVRSIGPARSGIHPALEEAFRAYRPASYRYDVFGADGQLRMTVELPGQFDPRFIEEGRAYGFLAIPGTGYAVALAEW